MSKQMPNIKQRIVKLKPTILHTCPKGRENHRTAQVQLQYGEHNDILYMDRDLRGCRWWNIDDVEIVQ